jgi:hypothetical protein
MERYYATVDAEGKFVGFYNDLSEALEERDEYIKLGFNVNIIDNKDVIDYLMFSTNGLNNDWFETYNEFFPYDMESKLKIPVEIFNNYFRIMFTGLMLEIRSTIKEENPSLNEKQINKKTKEGLRREINFCSPRILDALLDDKYVLV